MRNLLLVLAAIILISGCVGQSANQTLYQIVPVEPPIDNATEQTNVNPQVSELLETEEWVKVRVVLKDSSGIIIPKNATQEERHNLLSEMDRINVAVQSELIASLKSNEFKLQGTPSIAGDGFSGNISKVGLDKLMNDYRVVAIEPHKILTIQDTSPSYIDPKVLDLLEKQEWVGVTVGLKDIGDDEQNLIIQSEIIANLSELEFRIDDTNPFGRGFYGEISRKGLEKLRYDLRISSIYIPIVGGLAYD